MVKYLDNNSGFAEWARNQNEQKQRSKFGTFVWWAVLFAATFMLVSYCTGPEDKSAIRNQQSAIVETPLTIPTTSISDEKISANVQGIRISNIALTDYKDGDANVVLLGDSAYAEVGLIANGTTAPTATTLWRATRMANNNSQMWRNPDGIDFVRNFTVTDYTITITDEIKNNSNRDVSFAPFVRILRGAGDSTAVDTGAVAYANDDVEYANWKDKAYIYKTNSGFAGFADQYWETIAQIASPDQTITTDKVGEQYRVEYNAAPLNVMAGQTATITTKIFAGPRDPRVLASSGIDGIADTMDYGWFWFLSQPMLWAMNALHGFVGNYGIAIILLTIVLRLIMWPLTRKSYTSMAAMQKMQPEMQRIQKLYGNDKMRMQMELIKLYQTHKISPMSAFVPMLLQIPIFFALYKALLISVPMRGAGFLWMADLSVMDPYFILPILMGATMWWQQRLQSPAAGANADGPAAQMQKTMKWMPLMLTVLFAWMSAGLVLYWTVSNLFGIGQMYVIKRNAK